MDPPQIPDITHVIYSYNVNYIVAQWFIALNMFVVHFGLIQNEPKDQGCESIVGGCCRVTEKFQGRLDINPISLIVNRLMKFFNSPPSVTLFPPIDSRPTLTTWKILPLQIIMWVMSAPNPSLSCRKLITSWVYFAHLFPTKCSFFVRVSEIPISWERGYL